MAVTEKDVRDALKQVKDPELGLDLVVLGLIYDIELEEPKVKATISLTSPFCPVAGQIVEDVKTAIEGVDGVDFLGNGVGLFAAALLRFHRRLQDRLQFTQSLFQG